MIRILIVDDLKLLKDTFKYFIETNKDMKVVACASNDKEAVQLCSVHNPNLVLMAASMYECDGFKAAEVIKSKFKNIKVFMLTLSDVNFSVSKFIKSSADGYILKDVSSKKLVESIRHAMDGFEQIQ